MLLKQCFTGWSIYRLISTTSVWHNLSHRLKMGLFNGTENNRHVNFKSWKQVNIFHLEQLKYMCGVVVNLMVTYERHSYLPVHELHTESKAKWFQFFDRSFKQKCKNPLGCLFVQKLYIKMFKNRNNQWSVSDFIDMKSIGFIPKTSIRAFNQYIHWILCICC